MIDVETAEQQAKALVIAAQDSPILHIRTTLKVLGREWASAAADLKVALDLGETATIEMAGTLTRGMVMFGGSGDWVQVARTREGGASILVQTDYGSERWINTAGAQSPVVVRS